MPLSVAQSTPEESPGITARTAGPRYRELDGLRGLAAFTVLGHHFFLMYSLPIHWYQRPFTDGHQAVILFFLLSGFVLSLPFWNKGESGPYGRYLTRRIFRIYVPYVAAFALALPFAVALGHRSLPLSGWFYKTWHSVINARLILGQLFMSPELDFNTAFWSLRYEMQMSIIFPAFLLLLRKLRTPVAFVLIAATYLVAEAASSRNIPNPHYYLDTLRYGALFGVGALLARSRHGLQSFFQRVPHLWQWLLLLLAAGLYFGYGIDLMLRLHKPTFADPQTVLGAVGLLVLGMYVAPFRHMLSTTMPQYLGRISYSLYLVHGTVLFALVNAFYWKLSRATIGALFVVLSLALAHLFCVLVEEPSLRLGKRLATRLTW